MPFPKFTAQKYPPRLWALVGYPDAGKSTFSTQMRRPMLVIDSDQRYSEVLPFVGEDMAFRLSERPVDNTDPNQIAALLAANMPSTYVGTITVDSLTTIIDPIITQILVEHDLAVADYEARKAAGDKAARYPNLAAAMRGKAMAMRQLQDAVSRWGTDVLWIYHLRDARDEKAQKVVRETLSKTERERLTRSLNLELHIIREGSKRGVQVTWARKGRSGMTLWDDSGRWLGMPERIEAAVYDGLTQSDMARIEATPPEFADAEDAIAWGFERGAFRALPHARAAWEKLEREHGPLDLAGLVQLWVPEVERRLTTGETNGNGNGASHATASRVPSSSPATTDDELKARAELIRMIPTLIREHRITPDQANEYQAQGKKNGYVAVLDALKATMGHDDSEEPGDFESRSSHAIVGGGGLGGRS